MKKIIAFLLVLFSLFLLIGCGENNTTKPNNNTNEEVVAKLDSSKQGTYYGDDVTVVITESKVKITDPSGKTLEYTIYLEGDKYYILEDGKKVYCTFGDGTVTNSHGTFTKRSGGNTDTIAKLDSSKQGTYYGDDVTVVITESKVKITDPSGKTLEYTIYVEGDKYYILEDGKKVYCTFGDGTVTNSHGTFTKGGQSNPEKTKANIPAADQGDYFAGPVKITVYTSKVVVYEGSLTMEFDLYVDAKGIYLIEEGVKVYCTIGDGKVSNSFGDFTREGGMTQISAAEAGRKLAGFIHINGTIRIPEGDSIQDSTVNGEDTESYFVTVLNPKEDFSSYLTYLSDFLTKQGFTQSDSSFVVIGDDIIGLSVTFDEKTNTLTIAGAVIKGHSQTVLAADFLRTCNEKFGIELDFPTTVTDITDYYYSEDYGLGNLMGSFVIDGLTTATEATFNEFVGRLDAKLAPKGLAKGEPEIKKYANALECSVKWINENYDYVILELLIENDNYHFNINIFASVIGGETGDDTWPTDEIAKVFGDLVSIPTFSGDFESVFVNISSDTRALDVSLTEVNEKDFNVYIQSLLTIGFDETEVNGYTKYFENGSYAQIYAVLSQNVATFTFSLETQVFIPWPSAKIKEHFGELANTIIPVPNDGGKASYSSTYANDMLAITVDSGTQTDLMQKYIAQLRNSKFVDAGTGAFEYTFENNDVIHITVYSSSTAQNRFSISIEYKKYVGMRYNLPTNFVAQINDNGFTLTKIGESYVYRYDYANTLTKLEYFLFDSEKNEWLHAEGQILKQAGANGITWQNYGSNGEVINYQYVSRPQLDTFLSGTSGLAYMYYEEYLDAGTNAIKDPTKDAIIAGANCEYVKITQSMGSYYTATYELWIDLPTQMIYKVVTTLEMSGQTQTNTAFEIKSIDFSKTTLKDAGISNCMLPTFDKTNATDDDHCYGEQIEEQGTCGKDGVIYKVCSCCGEKKIISTIPATGQHHGETYDGIAIWFGDGEGHHSLRCTICHEFYDTEDCKYGDWAPDSAATCTHEGRHHRTCPICRDTQYETIPVDPNAHTYIGYYADNVTIIFPTKEEAGSITWSCREECGHTETIVLPKLEESSYIMGVYEDFLTNKNYKIYGLDLNKMITDINKFLIDTEKISSDDTSYITATLFARKDEFVYNYDYDNPIYGFLGEEIEDELASVPEMYRGELFNDNNEKIVLGENTLTITQDDGSRTFTLYARDNEIYFNEENSGYTNKVTLTFNDNGNVEVGDYGTFEKRIVAKLDKAYFGEYFGLDGEENEIKVEVSATSVKVTTGEKTLEYVLYVKDDNYFIVTSDNEIIYCYFDEDTITNDFGTFEKRVVAELDEAYCGEYFGQDDDENEIKVVVLSSSVKVTILDETTEYVLYIKGDDYYIISSDNEKIYCYFDENTVTNDFGTFERKSDENGENNGEEDNTEFPHDAVANLLEIEDFMELYYDDATYSYVEHEAEGDSPAFIEVIINLPDEANKTEVFAQLVEICGEYTEETGYYDLDNGYGLYIFEHEENNAIILMYYKLS